MNKQMFGLDKGKQIVFSFPLFSAQIFFKNMPPFGGLKHFNFYISF